MHIALARKYRPQNFTEVIGQDPVMRTLQNAITLGRLHHAYLFCGARGVGKTSLARILAKSVNCETGQTVTPCQTCSACSDITRGNSLDVIEIDAASHTGVDNIRELLEQVKFLPSRGKKIYIIDEVHMLSNSAFNALLKTLEEPPAHIMFVLATTEPHDIPVTILSRCQRFDFRKLGKQALTAHLLKILDAEGVRAEPGAVQSVAECAQGSVRDALSLLDQVIGYGGQDITEEQARAVLGLGERLLLRDTFRQLVTEDLQAGLTGLAAADERGLDLKIFAEGLIVFFRHLILFLSTQRMPDELGPSEQEFLRDLSGMTELSLVLAQYQVLFHGTTELSRTDFQRISLEITFVKMGRVREMIGLADLVVELKERAEKKGQQRPIMNSTASEGREPSLPLGQELPKDWYDFVKWVRKIKPPLGGILSEAVPIQYSDERIEIGFAPNSPSRSLVIERKAILEEVLSTRFGKKIPFFISDLEDEKKKPLSLTEMRDLEDRQRRVLIEKEVGENPAIRDLLSRHGARIKEIKVLKELT